MCPSQSEKIKILLINYILMTIKKQKKITEKLQKREGREVINGKVHLLKGLILLKAGRHLD